MNKLALLLLLAMAPGLDGIGVAFSHHAAGAGFPSTRSDALAVYEPTADHQTNALDEKNHSDAKRRSES
jgi:hypothetical protein